MNIQEFKEELLKININIDDEKLRKLELYYELLVEKNKVMNLTNIVEKNEVYLKHFYDSLTLNKIINLNNNYSLCDIGTGAGFPGIVLKIVFPNLKITLVDSLNKRIIFLKEVIEKLDLKDIEVYHNRMEEFSINHEEKFDIVTARAVAHLSNLLEYSSKSIKIGGYFIAMKGNILDELEESQNAIKILNFELKERQEFLLPYENSNRNLLKIEKVSSTPKKYPRKYSEIKKNRL